MSIPREIKKELLCEWEALEGLPPVPRRDKRREIIDRYCRQFRWSEQTFYRKLGQFGWDSGRRERIDKGTTIWDKELMLQVAKMLKETKRKDRHIIGNVNGIVEIMAANGLIKPEEIVTDATVRRYLRQIGLSKNQMMGELDGRSVFNHMRSLHPNHVHQFDISNCVQYYFDDAGLTDENVIELYKTENMKRVVSRRQILRYVLIDHASGAFYIRYYYSRGEDAETIIDFLWHAWVVKGDYRYPFCGAPDILVMDRGPGNKSTLVKNLLKNLNIKSDYQSVGNPRAKGGVESEMWSWEQEFEFRLSFQRPKNIDELNDFAWDFCIGYNGTATHKRHGMTRSRIWFEYQPEEIRKVPDWEIFQTFASFNPIPRKVNGDGWIMFHPPWAKNQPYSDFRILPGNGVVPADLKGKTVHVMLNPWAYPLLKILVNYGTENEFQLLAEPVEKDVFGFALSSPVWGQADTEEVKRQKHSRSQNAMKELDDVEIPELQVFGYHADKVKDNFIVPEGETIGAGAEAHQRMVGGFAAIQMLKEAGLAPHYLSESDREAIDRGLLKGRESLPRREVEEYIEEEKRKRFNIQGGR